MSSASWRIVVLAGDANAGRQYARALAPAGYDAQYCGDPRTALLAAAERDADAILVSEPSSDCDVLQILRDLKAARPAAKVIIVSHNATIEAAVTAMREGAADYLREPCSAAELRSAFRRLERAALASPGGNGDEDESDWPSGFEGMLGHSPTMGDVFALIERIAPADSTVLVTGESGTGKEMVVRAIHRRSRRKDHPLLACDCTALAPTLLESELFGHVKGSFSGAIATKRGLFEVAHEGTLLLDEVANLSMETQGKLLRVLETRMVRKVGDTAEHDVDIRLIATTNRSLAEMVKVGEFRADLYYRLNVVPITLPPLRERRGDVALMAVSFLNWFLHRMGLETGSFADEALRQLEIYSWPGNVRELRNIVERLAVLYGGSRIELSHLPVEIREARSTISTAELPRTWAEFKKLKRQVADDLERRFLTAALDRSSQNITRAAEDVGMQRTNFHALLRSHGLKPDGAKGS
jgi:DNA-binding NtrC family response regulator